MARTIKELEKDKSSGFANFKAKRNEAKGISQTDGLSKYDKLLEDPDSGYSKFVRKRNLAKKEQAFDSFVESEENIGFFEAIKPGGATPTDWRESRKKKKELESEKQEAAAQVAAYEQFLRDKEFQKKTADMSSEDIDKLLSDYDKDIEDYKNEKVGFFEAMKPGGVTPSQRREINSAMNSQINAIEAEQGKYRAIRDEKKSREMTEDLPEDVIKLLDTYNTLSTGNEGIDLSNMFVDASHKSHAQINSQKLEIQKQQYAIAQELKGRGYDNYEELAEYRKYITDKEETQKFETEMAEFTEEHPVISSVGNLGLMPARTITGAVGNMRALNNESDLGLNPYSQYYALTRANRAKKQTIENSFEDGMLSAEAKKFLYNTAESGVESILAATTLGGGGGVLLGMGAMNETVLETVEKGGTAEQALVSGIAAGAFEMIFESVSIGQFNALQEVSATTFKDAVLNVAKSSAVNFSEEAATEIANIAFDYWYNGGQSVYYETVVSLMQQGYSEAEAKNIANKQMAWQVTQAGLGGALMGAAFGGVGSASSAAGYNSALKEVGENIAQKGGVEAEISSASELGVSKDDAIYKFLQETEAYQSKKNSNADYKGTAKEFRSIAKLSEGLDRIASDKVNATSVSGIESRLKALGETRDINAVAKAVHKKLSGEKLSAREKAVIKESKFANRVVNEMTQPGITSSEWTEKVYSDIENIVNKRKAPDVEAYRSANSSENTAETAVSEENENTTYGFENYEKQVKEKIINQGQDKKSFDAAFELFKMYGETGRNFDEIKNNSTVSEDFTEVQMKAAYDIGKEKAEAQKITVVKEIKGKDSEGEVVISDVKGNNFKLSEINTDSTTRSLISNASKYDVPTSNVFLQGYNRSASVSSYTRAFDAFYSSGAASAETTFSEAMQKYGELTKYMAEKDVAKKAFDKGRAERLKADKAVKQKKQTGKHPAKGTYQSKTVSVGQEAVDELFSALAKKTVIDIDRVQSIRSREGLLANAQYDPTRNKMTTSATAENELQASIHELVHYAFAYNTEKMKPVKKAVIDYFLSQNSESEFEEILRRYGASYEGYSRADIEEEFVADALGGMFSTEDGVQDFLNWLQEESGYKAEEKKTILQRITEWLNDIIEAIRDIINSGELNGAGKLFAKENCDELTKIRKMFLEALDGAGVNYREGGAVEGNVRNSFAGIKAKTSNIQTFEAAQRLEDVGKATPEEIRQQTGWFRGYDGMWRFEIDDSKMVIRDTDIRSGETTLSEVLDYPQLFEAYPQLKDVTISAFPSIFRFGVKGSYNSERNEIGLSDEFLVDAKVHRELEALKKSEEYKAYKERLEGAAREHGEKRLKLSREFKKIREAKLYTDMVDLLYQLDDEGKVEEYKKAADEWQNSVLGKRYSEISAELKRMDEVNPQSEIEKAFRESELGKRYHELTLDVFSGGEVINDKDTRNTLIHEIQHAIQHIEGFASGSSPKYWKDINADPFSYTPSEIKRLEKVRNEAYSYLKMLEDEDIREDAQRYWYLNDHYFDDNLDTEGVDKEIAEIEARAEAFGYQDKLDRYFELENKVKLTFNEIERRRKRAPDELYQNTAGEIEARDATARLTLTAEERKNTRPDIDRKDVVFSDGGVSWMSAKKAKYDPEIASISEQIRNSQSVLNSMDIVGEATVPQVFKDKYEAGQWAISQLKAFGYQVDRQNFGKIYFGESDIKYGINYADTNAEKAALILIPKVLKRGIEIGHHGDHKLRQKETITFAGPVILNGIRGNMAVVVNMHGNKYSVHRILLPDGSSFKFSEKNNEVKQESYQGVTENSSLADTTSFTSVNSILDSIKNVKNSLSVNLDKSAELSKLEAEKKKYDDEIFTLRRDFDKLKRTDDYERLETAVVEAQGKGEEFNAAIDEYNKWLKESGMGEISRKLTEAKAKQSELHKEITRMQNDLHKDFMKSIESFDDETVAKYVNKAVRKFKTTSRFSHAGYITTTGSLLDFSDGQGYRVRDHREVKDVLDMPDYSEYSDGMIAFMNMGNIRLQSYGIDISKMPNSKQISVLRRFFNSLNGEVVVDFSQPDGHSAGSIEYPENTKADRILNDIKKYFDTGVVPELSDVQRFRYSLPLSNLNDLHRSNIEKVTELSRVAAQLTAHINYIGSSQTKRTLSTLNIQAVARELKKEYQSKADIHELTAELESLYKLFEQGRVSQDVVKAHVDSIAEKIINESVYMKPDMSDYAKEILRELRSVKIKLSDVQKQQAAYHFGSYNEFRKALMGSVVLSEEGTPLDERWQSLCGMFPGRFDSETVDTDQPYVLFETIKELRNTYDDESGLDIDSVKAQLSADICAGYISIPTVAEYSNQYSVLEQELLQSLKAEKQMYKQIYSESYKKAQSEYGVQLKKLRAEQAEEILRAKARMNQRVENIADTRLREKKRNRLIKTVKRLDRLLRNPGKGAPSAGTNKYGQEYVHLTNIPEDFKKSVIDFCYIFIENDAGVFTGKYKDSEGVARKRIAEIYRQYENLKESKTYISTAVNDDIKDKIWKAHEIVADKRLAQLTASELDTLNEIADHLITVINNEVEMWVNGKKTKVNDIGKAVLNEQNSKGMKGYIQAMKGIDKISVMNLKPIYFFEKVGGTLEKLWNDILGGQDRYVRNMQYAQQRFSDISKKYNLDSWIDDDAKTFKTEQGHEISLTRGQALLVWATWKREGIAGKDSKHLFEGGIVFPDAVEKASDKVKKKAEKDAKKDGKSKKEIKIEVPAVLKKVYADKTAHRIRIEDMLKIDEWLTKEQKAYADELVSFLSNDVAGWGNEISMQLYGTNKFNEKYYIPFNSAGEYLYKGMGDEGTKLLKSEGFTKETQWGANNPLVVDDFTQVVVKHIERMSMYNSMVLPLDNFSRVWNYQERADADSNDSTQNVKAAFKTAWGEEYTKYINDLLRDINGGVMSDSREIGDKWISKFKKAAVMGSASVMIQQPSAIVRAFSEVDTRYFVSNLPTKGLSREVYEECKKYAPVAVLKEIGGFDTVGGQSMTDWMLKRNYKGKDKLVAFFKDSQFRDDVISWGPAFADRITWAHIWLACKKEVKHTKGLSGEALLEATGKRFTEVINKTQVYDSVLSRSGAMRSQSTLMKMQTAFMAEPVTQWNMYGSAVRDLKKGDRKKAVRKIAAVIGAQAFNAVLVSIIYAARDDDEEKTQWEKYVAAVLGNFLDNLNPLTLVPFVKDLISIAQGYNIERTDVSVFSNVIDSITDMFNENMSWQDKALGFAGSTLDVFGFPFKNLVRDGKALVNTVQSLRSGKKTTSGGMIAAIREELAAPFRNYIKTTKDEYLYDAWVKGQESLYNEYASQYKSGSSIKSALKKQITERFADGELTYEKAAELLGKLGFSKNDVEYELRSITEPVGEEQSEDKNAGFFTFEGVSGMQASSDNDDSADYSWLKQALGSGNRNEIDEEIEYLENNGVPRDKINSVIKSWIKENDSGVDSLCVRYQSGDLSSFESEVNSIASKYGVDAAAVAGAVRSKAGYNSKAIEGTVYALSDLHISIENSKGNQSKIIADAIIEAKTQQYIDEGKSRKDAESAARQSVKSSLTSKWKEIYQKADGTTKVKIRKNLYDTGVYDNLSQLDDKLKDWREEWQKEQNK